MSHAYTSKLYNDLMENHFNEPKIREPNDFQFYDAKPSEYYKIRESTTGVKTIYASIRLSDMDNVSRYQDIGQHIKTKLAYNFAEALFNENLMIIAKENDHISDSTIYRAKINIVDQNKYSNTSNLTYEIQKKVFELHGEEFNESEIEEALKTHYAERFI